MIIKKMFLAFAMAVAATSAFADDQSFSIGLVPTAPSDYYKQVSHDVGSFTDTFSFSVAWGSLYSTANILMVANAVPHATNPYSSDISNLSYTVYEGAKSLGTYSAGLATWETHLDAGSYSIMVTGLADGTHGGTYGIDLTTATPMPEPSTYAMLLGGLGLIGFIARRRKNQA
jgi:hypothetical protein